MNIKKLLMSSRDVSKFLGVPIQFIRVYVQSGLLVPVFVHSGLFGLFKDYRFAREDVEAFALR